MRTTQARSTDPDTSREAADRLTPDKLTAAQARVLAMFRLYGEMHDAQLVKYLHEMEYSAGFTRGMSPSGVRSRRSELSKPNMERLDEIACERGDCGAAGGTAGAFGRAAAELQSNCRDELRREGFRAPLWDTGKRVVVDGSRVIVWGLAV